MFSVNDSSATIEAAPEGKIEHLSHFITQLW
jgi:hypothetical protein